MVVSVEQFGKDHWSLLAYVETCCNDVDHYGRIDFRRMRINENKHPLLKQVPMKWKPDWGTRLAGFFELQGHENPQTAIEHGVLLPDHDDVDCLDDFAAADYLIIDSLVNGWVKLFPKGIEIAEELKKHKASGGFYSNFKISIKEEQND